MLDPEEVRKNAERPVNLGLVASSGRGYAEMEDFLLPGGMAHQRRLELMERVHRADDPDPPPTVDLVLYQHGTQSEEGAYTFDRDDPQSTVAQILDDHDELALPLARQFPAFRKPVVDGIIQAVSRENALFAIATALPNVAPNLLELPWAIGEFASDTVFLTANQIRMAFLIAAACGKDAGLGRQKAEVLSIIAAAFGWRALARELVGKIPLGGGLIPKGAIAYAGTFVAGKSLEYFHHANVPYSEEQRGEAYREALERGKQVAESLHAGPPSQ